MKQLPSSVASYQRTAEFTEQTIPAGLRRRHSTRADVWARICVVEGTLVYRILGAQPEEHVLTPKTEGVVEPRVPHEVDPVGSVRFFVEFLR